MFALVEGSTTGCDDVAIVGSAVSVVIVTSVNVGIRLMGLKGESD